MMGKLMRSAIEQGHHSGYGFDDERTATSVRQGRCVVHNADRVIGGAPSRAKVARFHGALRQQPNVTNDGNSGPQDCFDSCQAIASAFEF